MIVRRSRSGERCAGIATVPKLPAPPACTLRNNLSAAMGSLR